MKKKKPVATLNPADLQKKLEELRKHKNEIESKKQLLKEKYEGLQKKTNLPLAPDIAEATKYMEIPKHNIRIPFYDLNRLNTRKEGLRVAIFGNTGSGKSYLARMIMKHNQDIPYWVIFSGSESRNKQYSRHLVNDLTVYYNLDIDALEKIHARQLKVVKEWRIEDENKELIGYEHDPSIGIILDDVVEDEATLKKNPIFSYFHCVSRHDKVLFIELFQYYTMLISKYRRQCSHVFIMRPTSESEYKSMHREFFSMYSYSIFKEIVDKCTENHGALVVEVNNQSADRVFYYRAPEKIPNFVCGTKKSKKLQKFFYNPEWENDTIHMAQMTEETKKEAEELEKQIAEEEAMLKQQEKFLQQLQVQTEKKNNVQVVLE